MWRYFVVTVSLLFVNGYSAFSFEIEKANDDYNIVFVKNKRPVNESKMVKKKLSTKIKNAKNTNATNNINVYNNKATKPVSNTKMYASATGNISVEDANNLLKVSVNNQTKQGSKSKVIVSYSGNSVVVDNELCKMVARNDVVNVKKTLSMMKYNSKYVNWRCENNTPLLLLAVEHNNLLVAKLLIEKGANVNLVDDAGVSPLHWVARSHGDDVMDMFALIVSVDNLIVNMRDIEGYTPLMRAVEFENVDIVNTLLGKQSDVYIKNNYGESAVELASKRLEAKKNNDDKTNIERILKMLEVNV